MSTRALLYESELTDKLSDGLRRAKEFWFALALISVNGLGLLLDDMRACLDRGGRGGVLAGIDLPTHPDAFAQLLQLSLEYPKAFAIRKCQSPENRYFHPKLYLCLSKKGSRSAVVGSSNLTDSGLTRNYEASIWTDDNSTVADLFEYFDELFTGGHSRPVTEKWLNTYRRSWVDRQKIEAMARKARNKIRKLKESGGSTKVPTRIKGYRFVFTGKIDEWPRKKRLYPQVERLGGSIGGTATAAAKADCLVHGDIFQKGRSTRKLKQARATRVMVISEEEFMSIMEKEKQIRRGRA